MTPGTFGPGRADMLSSGKILPAMQKDHFTASRELTRALTSLALFLVAIIVFQLFTGEIFGGKWNRRDEPRGFWIVMSFQAVAFIVLVILLYLHAG